MELIFVYNAKKGLANKVVDGLHKVVSPATYACDLCAITYHAAGKRKQWKEFLKESNIPMHFFYTNSIPAKFDKNFSYPAVLRYENSTVTCILDKQDFAAINDLNEFIVLLEEKVPELSRK